MLAESPAARISPRRHGQFGRSGLETGRGGDLVWLEPGASDPAFEEAAFKLEAEPFEPVLGTNGYHLILVREIKPESRRQFAEVKAELEKYTSVRSRRGCIQRWPDSWSTRFIAIRSRWKAGHSARGTGDQAHRSRFRAPAVPACQQPQSAGRSLLRLVLERGKPDRRPDRSGQGSRGCIAWSSARRRAQDAGAGSSRDRGAAAAEAQREQLKTKVAPSWKLAFVAGETWRRSQQSSGKPGTG